MPAGGQGAGQAAAGGGEVERPRQAARRPGQGVILPLFLDDNLPKHCELS